MAVALWELVNGDVYLALIMVVVLLVML